MLEEALFVTVVHDDCADVLYAEGRATCRRSLKFTCQSMLSLRHRLRSVYATVCATEMWTGAPFW